MGPVCNNFALVATFFFLRWIEAIDYYEPHHKNQISAEIGHFTEIPKRFEIRGENAITAFNKYLSDIQSLASKKNLSIVYKVKVDSSIKTKRKNRNKDRLSKGKSKKFLVPLKKKSMKLSSFEIVLRKRANELGLKHNNYEEATTTERQKVIFTTRQVPVGKYKPIVGGVRTNYVKIVRPVKNSVITLDK